MKLYEFNNVSEQNKYDNSFKGGTFIEYRLNGNLRFVLYAVFKFFVEVEYSNEENKIKNLKSFKEGELLNQYIFFLKMIKGHYQFQ